MPRNKVKIAFIEKRAQRKASLLSFKKRKESLFKKMNEICIFCDVKICPIIYSQNRNEAEVWPHYDGAINVINDFKEKSSEIAREKRMNTQESGIQKSNGKDMEQSNKQIMENREIEMTNIMSKFMTLGEVSLADLNATELKDLVSFAGQKISQIDERLELLKNETPAAPTAQHESQIRQQPKEVMQGGISNNANDTVADGSADVDCYVPAVMENPEGYSDEIQTTGWNPDWLDDLVRLDMEFDRMMIPVSDDSNDSMLPTGTSLP